MKEKAVIDKAAKPEEHKSKGREEAVIKFGFIALGIILVISIIAFGVISILPNNIISIGDKKIAEEEFDYHYYEQTNMLYQQILEYYPDVSLEVFMLSEYQSGMTYHEFAKQLSLERISEVEILLAMAREENYSYDENEFLDSKENFKSSFNEYANRSDISVDDAARELYGCDFDTVLKIYEKTWLSSKYQDDMLRDFGSQVTDEEAVEYYEKFKDDLDKVTLKQLFISVFDTETQEYYDEEAYAKAKSRAEAILERINNGEDFDALVMELSEDPSIEETEGEYISRKSEIGLAALEEWAFAEERVIGEIDMVETEIGFHIVKYILRSDYDTALDSVKSNIAYGKMLNILAEKRALPEFEVGYYKAFSLY